MHKWLQPVLCNANFSQTPTPVLPQAFKQELESKDTAPMDKTAEAHHEEVCGQAPSDLSTLEAKGDGITVDNDLEHQLTLRDIIKHHKALVFWSFFWALCAIGWGFDAQVNGAMISGNEHH